MKRVAVLSSNEMVNFLEEATVETVTELRSINILIGRSEVTGDYVAISTAEGECAVITNI